MLKSYFFILLCFGFALDGYCQYSETIVSSRPGQAFVPFTTGKKVLQIQNGISYSKTELEPEDNLVLNQLLQFNTIRYGVSESFELRVDLAWNNEEFKEMDFVLAEQRGLRLVNPGFRYNIWHGDGNRPSIGIQANAQINMQTESRMLDEAVFTLLHSQRIFWELTLTSNWSVEWLDTYNDLVGGYVINLAFPIWRDLGGFVETYGTYFPNPAGTADWDILFDAGFAYLLHPDLQLDLSAGMGDNDDETSWFVDAGISWRVKFNSNSSN